jgi:uncharacterized RDD family membrane protein YckC
MSMAPGWYPDPFSVGYVRYWDGQAWSSQTQVAPRTDEAPLPSVPQAAPPGAPATAPPAPSAPATSAPPTYAPPTYGVPPPPPYGSNPYGAPPPPQAPPWAGYQPYPPQAPAATVPLASWGSRFAARLIDWIIVGIVLIPVYILVLYPDIQDFINQVPTDGSAIDTQVIANFQTAIVAKAFFLGLLAALAQMVYEVPQLVAYGRTVGKRVLGIRVRMFAEDRRPGWGEASIRVSVLAFGQLLLSGLFVLLDCLWPLWDKPWQQALHDKAAKTIVVPK